MEDGVEMEGAINRKHEGKKGISWKADVENWQQKEVKAAIDGGRINDGNIGGKISGNIGGRINGGNSGAAEEKSASVEEGKQSTAPVDEAVEEGEPTAARNQSAIKSDGAAVPTYIWHQHLV